MTGAKALSGTPVQQYTSNDSRAQKWIAVPVQTENGKKYRIISALSDTLQLGPDSKQLSSGTKMCLVNESSADILLFLNKTKEQYKQDSKEKVVRLETDTKTTIDGLTDLSDNDKSSFKDQLSNVSSDAQNTITKAKSVKEVDQAITDYQESQAQILEDAKEFNTVKASAKSEVSEKLGAVTKSIDDCHNLTKDVRENTYKLQANTESSDTINNIISSSTVEDVENAKNTGITNLETIEGNAKDENKTSYWTLKFDLNGHGTQIQPVVGTYQ